MKRRTITMAGAFAGMVSPVLFGAVLALLTALQHDFMIGIGWRPLVDPADAWPSGLALGPYGFLQIANFVASGLLLALFAIGLHLEVGDGRGSEVGPCLLFVAGAAMALMGFETDPIRRVGPRTLHGLIHDAAFVLFVLALLAALFMLGQRFKMAPRWRGHAHYTLSTGMLAVLLLFPPGVAYYLFIVTVLTWIFATAICLWRLL